MLANLVVGVALGVVLSGQQSGELDDHQKLMMMQSEAYALAHFRVAYRISLVQDDGSRFQSEIRLVRSGAFDRTSVYHEGELVMEVVSTRTKSIALNYRNRVYREEYFREIRDAERDLGEVRTKLKQYSEGPIAFLVDNGLPALFAFSGPSREVEVKEVELNGRNVNRHTFLVKRGEQESFAYLWLDPERKLAVAASSEEEFGNPAAKCTVVMTSWEDLESDFDISGLIQVDLEGWTKVEPED